MECLRLLSQRSRASGTSVNVVPGQAVSATTVDIDVLPNSMEVFTRARAWFVTLAFISIRNPKWFDLQTALFAAEKVLELVQCTSGGVAPPLSHFIGAWAATVNYFSEQVRITGESVIVFVKTHRLLGASLDMVCPSVLFPCILRALRLASQRRYGRGVNAGASPLLASGGRPWPQRSEGQGQGKGQAQSQGQGQSSKPDPRERSRFRNERK